MGCSTNHPLILLLSVLLLAFACANVYGIKEVHVSAGARQDYEDSKGVVWASDRYYLGGKIVQAPSDSNATQLYSTTRVANSRRNVLSYTVENFDAGDYLCKLHFCEVDTSAFAEARRVFHVLINGVQVQTSLDVFKEAGGKGKPLVKTYSCKPDASGKITISFGYFIGEPMISAFEIVADSVVPAPPPVFVPDPKGDPNPTLPVEKALYRINCGSTVEYVDTRGKTWAKDQYYVDPTIVDRFDNKPWKPLEPHPYGIDGTYDQTILLTERYYSGSFSYIFPNVPRGKYLVRLYWAELYEGNFILYDPADPTKGLKGVGARVFSVSANGVTKLEKVDVFQSVGPYSQLMREFWVDVTTEGQIKLDFGKIVESPMIQGIEIVANYEVIPQQVLPSGRKQGLASLYYDYSDYFQSPIMTMPEGGTFTKPVSFIEVTDYYNNPNNYGKFHTSPFMEQFAMRVLAYVRVPQAGKYRYTLESNDGSQMWVYPDTEGKTNPIFIDNDGNHANYQKYNDITFAAPGFYPVLIKYFQGHINTCLRIYWMTPSDNWSEYVPYNKVGRIIAPEYWSYDENVLVPVVTKVDPNHGTVNGGNTIQIYGMGFTKPGQTKCRFHYPGRTPSDTDATIKVDSDGKQLSCVVPKMLGGMGQVQVIVVDKNNAATVIQETNKMNYFFDF